MPNYVINNIKIQSDNNKDLISFLDKHLINDVFDFNTIIPEPTTEEECPQKYNFNFNEQETDLKCPNGLEWFDWYHWRLDHWGVKWNNNTKTFFDYNKILSNKDIIKEISISFDTPWNVPLPLAAELISMHPELNIDWEYYSFENMEAGSIYFFDDSVIHMICQLDRCKEDNYQINNDGDVLGL